MSVDRQPTGHTGISYREDANGVRSYIVFYHCSGCDGPRCRHGHTQTLPKGASLKDAKALRAEKTSKLARGERIVVQKIRVDRFAHDWLETQEGNLAKSTVDLYRWAIDKWIVPAFGHKLLNEVTIDDVAALVARMKAENKKAWTIKNVLTPLSRIMSHAVRRGLAPANPVRGLDKSERPKADQRAMRILTSAEIEKLLSGKDDEGRSFLTARWRPLIALLVFTGLRISEALALEWEDVDFENGLVTVRRSKTLAGVRRVVLMPGLSQALREHLVASGRRTGLCFCTDGGTRLDRRYVGAHVLRPAIHKTGVHDRGSCPRHGCKECRVTQVTPHELRHTYASLLIGQGMDVTFVADQLGHADPSITLSTYAQLYDSESRKNEAREKLEAKFGGMM